MALSIRDWNLIILVVVLFLTLQSPWALAQDSGQGGLRFDAVSSTDDPVSGLMVNLTSTTYNGTAEFFNYTDEDGRAEFQLDPGIYTLSLHFQDTEVPHDLVDLRPDDILTEDWNIVISGDEDLSVTLGFDEDFYEDTDGDGLPDWWEVANGHDPLVKNGGGLTYTEDGPGEDGSDDTDDQDYGLHLVIVTVVIIVVVTLAYTKIRRDRILEHTTRESIYNYIKAQPGTHLRGIKNELELSMGVLNHHLNLLEQQELIRSKTERQYKRYYPYYYSKKDSPLLSSAQKAVYNIIVENPGITPPNAALLLKRSKRNVYNHINTLEGMGLIRTRKDGKHLKCYIMDET